MSQNTWGAGGGSTGLGWTAVSSPRIGPSQRWTLGGAVAAKVWGGGIFGKAVRTLRGRQRREAKEEEQWTREKEDEGGIERESNRERHRDTDIEMNRDREKRTSREPKRQRNRTKMLQHVLGLEEMK